MITRSDAHTSETANYGYMMPTYLNGSQGYDIDSVGFQYGESTLLNLLPNRNENPFQSMIHNLHAKIDESIDSISDDESLETSDDLKELDSHSFHKRTGEYISKLRPDSKLPKCIDLPHVQSMNESKDILYSRPITPCDSMLDSNDSTIPLAQIEDLSFDSHEDITKNNYDDSMPRPSFLEQSSYDTSSVMYGNDDVTMFSGLVNCDEVLRNPKKIPPTFGTVREAASESEDISVTPPKEDSPKFFQAPEETSLKEILLDLAHTNTTSPYAANDNKLSDEGKNKKLTGLQKRALDSIFGVTDRPSRGLVIHIAAELNLHHITVKNFFSNGRRRLRRAAARLNDPERTRRENQRRKEKRRLAALAATLGPSGIGDKSPLSALKNPLGEASSETHQHREPPVLSPERRALMEKLAVKVQKSVAKKGLQQALLKEPLPSPSPVVNQQLVNDQDAQNIDFVMRSQLHSKIFSSTEDAQTFRILTPECGISHVAGDNIDGMLSCSESEHVSSYHSSPDQELAPSGSNQDQNTMPYYTNEEGPYSPTSWQTLLNS